MFTRSPNVPEDAYVFAAAVGVVGLPFMYLLADFVAVMRVYSLFTLLISMAFIGIGYVVLGAAFGFVWPGAAWRWGVWLCAAPTCAAPFLTPDGRVFLAWAALTLLPACAGAHAARRLHLRYVGAP